MKLKKSASCVRPSTSFSRSVVVCVNALLFFLVVVIPTENIIGCLAVSLVLALAFFHSYQITHECIHRSFFKSKLLNIFFGNISAILCGHPFDARTRDHLAHHTWVSNPKLEPSTKRGLENIVRGNLQDNVILQLSWKYWVPIFSLNELWELWKGELLYPAGRILQVLKKFFTLGLTCLYLFFLFKYIGPVFLFSFYLFFVLVEYFNLPHHVDSPLNFSDKPTPLWEQDSYSKSCMPLRSAALNKYFCLNFNYHEVHHLFPNKPWQALPQIDRLYTELNLGVGRVEEFQWHTSMRPQPVFELFKRYLQTNGGKK